MIRAEADNKSRAYRNPKFEYRNPKQIRMSGKGGNGENGDRLSDFELPASWFFFPFAAFPLSDLFRYSDFGFRVFLHPGLLPAQHPVGLLALDRDQIATCRICSRERGKSH
jgi:hypothetical protein